jgi:hypothetical protein
MSIEVLCDLRAGFGPARDQGARPTCLAFAASDAHAALRLPWNALSCEFAFYHAQRRAGRPASSGAVLSSMLTALSEDGQPVETAWPYLDALPSDLGTYSPPQGVAVFRRRGETRPPTLDVIVDHLLSGGASLVSMTISDAFYAPDADGVVRAPAGEKPDPARRHAFVAVGCGRVDGGRAILIRNSWGSLWGIAGHGWLPESYLTPRLTRVALLTEDIDVPTQNISA